MPSETILELVKRLIPKNIYWLLKHNMLRNFIISKKWESAGKPVPAPHVIKQFVIKEYCSKYNIPILVETGTFLGDMVYAQKNNFEKVISIELDQKLFESAVKLFSKCSNVQILHGDSGEVLKKVVPSLKKRSIFWLDGHYSGGVTAKGEKDCPVYKELTAILKSDLSHIILIDDARCFVGKGDYPTIKQLERFIKSKNKEYFIEVKDDIIRFTIN